MLFQPLLNGLRVTRVGLCRGVRVDRNPGLLKGDGADGFGEGLLRVPDQRGVEGRRNRK